MAAEANQKRGNGLEILLVLIQLFSIAFGWCLGPYIPPFPLYLRLRNFIKNIWAMGMLLGVGALDFFACIRKVRKWIAEGLHFFQSKWVTYIRYTFLIIVYVLTLMILFTWGDAVLRTNEDNSLYHNGNVLDPDEIKSGLDIYVTVVLEDGSKPQDPNVQYEVIRVQSKKMPLWKMAFDFPRSVIRQVEELPSIEVTVKPIRSDVVVQFSDPLISYGSETVMWTHDQDLLGDTSAHVQEEYSPTFEYRFDKTTWTSCPITGTKISLSLQNDETIFLQWDNMWELAHREILNHQEGSARKGDTVNFYYPGQRIELNLDKIRHSKSFESALADKLKETRQYCLSLESFDLQTVYCGSDIIVNSVISASSLPEQAPCFIKTGREIVYHCYDGADDLGYYIVTDSDDRDIAVWEKVTLGNKETVVLCLKMN